MWSQEPWHTRKEALFPDDDRIIVQWELSVLDDNQYHLIVASAV